MYSITNVPGFTAWQGSAFDRGLKADLSRVALAGSLKSAASIVVVLPEIDELGGRHLGLALGLLLVELPWRSA